jgi:hypothetical protein
MLLVEHPAMVLQILETAVGLGLVLEIQAQVALA